MDKLNNSFCNVQNNLQIEKSNCFTLFSSYTINEHKSSRDNTYSSTDFKKNDEILRCTLNIPRMGECEQHESAKCVLETHLSGLRGTTEQSIIDVEAHRTDH